MRIKKSDIREAKPEDASLLNFVVRQCFADVARRFDLTAENCPAHPSNSTMEKIKEDMARGVSFFLKIDMGIPAGCVGIEKADEETCHIVRLGVLPGRRGRGFGGQLLEKAVLQAKDSGAKAVSAGIIAQDNELKKWYEKRGFVETETKEIEQLPFQVSFMKMTI